MQHQRIRLIFVLSVLFVFGFLATSLLSYYVSLHSLRSQITNQSLPLTSDNIYTEIQRDLLRPIWISSHMANNTFLRDWVLAGEQGVEEISRYLDEVMRKNGVFTSFFVSDITRNYYYPDGILKKVDPEKPRDEWFFRVREMTEDYELNVDPDMANRDAITIFINYRVFDYEGSFIGATGVGLKVDSVREMTRRYREKYNYDVMFVDPRGGVVVDSRDDDSGPINIHEVPGLSGVADSLLTNQSDTRQYSKGGVVYHVNSRFVPELKWYLLVQQAETGTVQSIRGALAGNLLVAAIIAAIAISLTVLTLNAYERLGARQRNEIVAQRNLLQEKNAELEKALAEVHTLGGLLPICSSCKKIRDDQGYWKQIEIFIEERSGAEFTHGFCPECAEKIYPGINRKINGGDQAPPPGTATE